MPLFPPLIERYRSRMSGPLLDRIDLHVEIPAVSLRELRSGPGEPTAMVAERVAAARLIQQERFGAAASTPVNAARVFGPRMSAADRMTRLASRGGRHQ